MISGKDLLQIFRKPGQEVVYYCIYVTGAVECVKYQAAQKTWQHLEKVRLFEISPLLGHRAVHDSFFHVETCTLVWLEKVSENSFKLFRRSLESK